MNKENYQIKKINTPMQYSTTTMCEQRLNDIDASIIILHKAAIRHRKKLADLNKRIDVFREECLKVEEQKKFLEDTLDVAAFLSVIQNFWDTNTNECTNNQHD